jgi:hypothetical protein
MQRLPQLSLLVLCYAAPIWTGVSGAMPLLAAPWDFGLQQCNADLLNVRDDLRQRQAAFLRRLRAADPQNQTIERAVFNEQNDLGLILNRRVDLDAIPKLMRSVLVQMARAFPGQDLTVLAYAPSNPPHLIGTARLNARTRDMTYTPER